MTFDIEKMREDRDAGTPGPWGWEVNLASQIVELCGGKGGTDLTVMSFVRWGMQHAAPMFWKWCDSIADEPMRADKISVAAPKRKHHADWFRRIDHPDARRIARVPEMEAEIERLTAEVRRLSHDPLCTLCGHPKSNHPFRHMFRSEPLD